MIDPRKRDYPYNFIKKTIEIFNERNGRIIVEIGSSRMNLNHPLDEYHHDCCCDGHSSAHWALTKKEFYSVDIDPNSINTTKNIVWEKFKCKNAQIIQQDGLEFLKNFNKIIDLLFLDAWDVEGTDYAEKHLEAYLIAKKNLNDSSLILIDDTDVYWDFNKKELFFSNDGLSGKGKLVIPEAQKDGYNIIFNGRQTLLAKGIIN